MPSTRDSVQREGCLKYNIESSYKDDQKDQILVLTNPLQIRFDPLSAYLIALIILF
jgi:hypothetical protein